MSEHPFRGLHILEEMYGIQKDLLMNRSFLVEQLTQGIARSGATLCSLQVKEFDSGGLSILALLSESHSSIHTYPEFGALFFDAFTCGDRCAPQRIADQLASALEARQRRTKRIERGEGEGTLTQSVVLG